MVERVRYFQVTPRLRSWNLTDLQLFETWWDININMSNMTPRSLHVSDTRTEVFMFILFTLSCQRIAYALTDEIQSEVALTETQMC